MAQVSTPVDGWLTVEGLSFHYRDWGGTGQPLLLLHGLAWVDKADFAHANRLYRSRQSLSNAALGHLALTFVRNDRQSIAAELLALLNNRSREIRRGRTLCRRMPTDGCSAWMNSELEVTGLVLLAQLSVDPRAANVKQMVDYLASSIRSNGWRPHKARGTVIASPTTYYARGRQEVADYTLTVLVNGREVKKSRPGSFKPATCPTRMIAGEPMPWSLMSCSILSSVPRTERCLVRVPHCTTAAGVAGSSPCRVRLATIRGSSPMPM